MIVFYKKNQIIIFYPTRFFYFILKKIQPNIYNGSFAAAF